MNRQNSFNQKKKDDDELMFGKMNGEMNGKRDGK